MFLRGTTTSSVVSEAMADLYSLKKPLAVMLQKRNNLHPFEGGQDEASLDFFAQQSDAALALFASHSKKRPHNMVLMRFFDQHVLEMAELGITEFRSIASIKGPTCAVGTKPAILFGGALWEQETELRALRSMFLDFFRGREIESLDLAMMESFVSLVALPDGVILLRVYRVLNVSSGEPRLELMGPSINWKLGRVRIAPNELMKQAMRQPKELRPTKVKNEKTTSLGDTMGRVHVGRQQIEKIQTRKVKALKRSKNEPKEE